MINIFFRNSVLLSLVIFTVGCESKTIIRKPIFAGSFYPKNKKELVSSTNKFINDAKAKIKHTPRALVVPHAGYVYSGVTAGYAYKLLENKQINRVILLAPSHNAPLNGISVSKRFYSTPLGTYESDKEAISKLLKLKIPHSENEIAQTSEHSDEVQIPFLQTILPNAKLVPILVGNLTQENTQAIAKAISSIIDDRTIIIASSDFTHYGNRFNYTPKFKGSLKKGIEKVDKGAINFILKGDFDGFRKYLNKTNATICGRNPIKILLQIFKLNGWKPHGTLLKYTTSGEKTGNYNTSVSYAAISLGKIKEKSMMTEKYLNTEEEKTLVKLARYVLKESIEKNTSDFPLSKLKDFKITDNLKKEFGVFVTLKINNQLRGCIGHIIPQHPLYEGVIQNAINASSKDPRFGKVRKEEIDNIHIEISVMSPLMKVNDIEEIKVGRDGLVLSKGYNTGVFLPQVPVEWNWDKKQYLEELGRKAGLPKSAYQDKDTEIQRFTAQIFEEEIH